MIILKSILKKLFIIMAFFIVFNMFSDFALRTQIINEITTIVSSIVNLIKLGFYAINITIIKIKNYGFMSNIDTFDMVNSLKFNDLNSLQYVISDYIKPMTNSLVSSIEELVK